MGVPLTASQTRAVSSWLMVATRVESGLKTACSTAPLCCKTGEADWPLTGHTRAVWSALAVTIRVPSGLNSAEKIAAPWNHICRRAGISRNSDAKR